MENVAREEFAHVTTHPCFEELTFRPSLLSQLGKFFLAIVILVGGLPLSLLLAERSPETQGVFFALSIVVYVVATLVLLSAFWRVYNQNFHLCDDYLSSNVGILSTSLCTTRILYAHIRGIEIRQSLLQRILGLGDLHIGTDINKGESEMCLCGVRHPFALKDLLLHRAGIRLEKLGLHEKQM